MNTKKIQKQSGNTKIKKARLESRSIGTRTGCHPVAGGVDGVAPPPDPETTRCVPRLTPSACRKQKISRVFIRTRPFRDADS